jgi:hypothetical protein
MHENINIIDIGEDCPIGEYIDFSNVDNKIINVIEGLTSETISSMLEKGSNLKIKANVRGEALERIEIHVLMNKDANIASCLNAIDEIEGTEFFVSKSKASFLPVSSSYV